MMHSENGMHTVRTAKSSDKKKDQTKTFSTKKVANITKTKTHHEDFNMDSDSTENLVKSYKLSKSQDNENGSANHLNSTLQINNTGYNNEPHSINNMPPEILLLIFSQISHKPDLVPLLLVCKSWANLIVELIWFRPSLMYKKNLEELAKIMRLDRSETFWDYRQYIRRLNLSFIFEHIDDEFLSLFNGSTNLERLTLVNCTKLTYQPIVNILQNCEKLQSIDMTGVRDIRNEIFLALAKNCPRLQGLYAPSCPQITNEVLFEVVNSCPMLKRVKLSDCENLSDESMIEISTKCKSLIEVDVQNCPNLTDFGLQKLFQDLDQLREFRISQNQNVSDNLLGPLSDGIVFDRLRILDFTNCQRITDRTVEKVVQSAPRLRNMVLSKCSNITDTSLRYLSSLGKSLHYIHLGHCNSITDYGVITLLKNCHRLQYIDLACCTQLTNASLIELAQLPRLRRIGLVKCSNINDAGILSLVQRRGLDDTLERVHLSYCTNITLFPIYQLLKSCPKLTHLSLTGILAFLRTDITQFCRPPPSDFNQHQRSLFCVFSGQGVKKLRDYLERLFESHIIQPQIATQPLPGIMDEQQRQRMITFQRFEGAFTRAIDQRALRANQDEQAGLNQALNQPDFAQPFGNNFPIAANNQRYVQQLLIPQDDHPIPGLPGEQQEQEQNPQGPQVPHIHPQVPQPPAVPQPQLQPGMVVPEDDDVLMGESD